MSVPSATPKPVMIFGADGISGNPAQLTSAPADTDANSATNEGLLTLAYLYGYNGATWDRIRIANTFFTASVTAAGSTAVWTPGAGNLFRLMGFSISVAGTLAAAGIQVLELLDGATVFKNFNTYLSATPSNATVFAEDMGQGYLSIAAANVLNIHLGTAMATGAVTINVWGTQGASA
jgi:hypothetical protein